MLWRLYPLRSFIYYSEYVRVNQEQKGDRVHQNSEYNGIV